MNKSTKKNSHKTHTDKSTHEKQDTSCRLGFMQGEFTTPDDFDQLGKNEIAHLFKAETISTRGYRLNQQTKNER
jgi:hypothetical protein